MRLCDCDCACDALCVPVAWSMRKQEREMRRADTPLPSGTTAAAKTSATETISATSAVSPTTAAVSRRERFNGVRSAGGVVKWAILVYASASAFHCPHTFVSKIVYSRESGVE